MNKTAIKNYAIWARVQLIEAVKQKAYEYGITAESLTANSQPLTANSYPLTAKQSEQRSALLSRVRANGFDQVMEEAAYTWFNRFIALRFMEVNGYLPSKVRVFTDETGAFKPEILKSAMTVEIEGLDRNRVLELLDKQDNEALYKYLLITQCNALNSGLPYMFEKISNWTELLFPANLLRADSVIGRMISDIPEEDWTDAVQIIGWLYQYYNSELKDETFALLKKNVKITKERIPAATQLFTPDWIVRYMVENSLGRIAVSSQLSALSFDSEEERQAKEKEIAESYGWKYYFPEAEQTPEVRKELTANCQQLTADPTSLRVLDPCMGSGHILVYAFDVLMQIYTSAGWSERDAAKSIIENNLYGLDIDDRAGQLAYFAVMMKARKYSRRILNGEVKPNVLSIQDSNWITEDYVKYFGNCDEKLYDAISQISKDFRDAKEYGSILNVKGLDYNALYERCDIIGRSAADDLSQLLYIQQTKELLLPLIRQHELMSQKYDVVVTNPPYMGNSGMSAKLSEFVKKYYPDSKSDLFACFIERGCEMAKTEGYNSMVTMQSWMFLSSFENMRKRVLSNKRIVALMHMENMVMHIAFGTAVTVFQNKHIANYKGTYNQITLKDIIDDENERPLSFPVAGNRFAQVSTDNFSKIPGSPIAYWVSEAFIHSVESSIPLENEAYSFQGMITGDNDFFLRLWYEVSRSNSCFHLNRETAIMFDNVWVPYNKGGEYRRWYGNNYYLLRWIMQGKTLTRARTENSDYYFRQGVTWSFLTSGLFSARFFEEGALWDVAGSSVFSIGKVSCAFMCALMNSKYAQYYFDVTNPTINYQVMNILSLPIKGSLSEELIETITKKNILLSKTDWNSFETSWDFKRHPLV